MKTIKNTSPIIFFVLAMSFVLQCKKATKEPNIPKYKLVPLGITTTQRNGIIPLADGNILLRHYLGFNNSGLILKKVSPKGDVLWDKDFLLTGLYNYGFGAESKNGNLFFSTRGYNQSNSKLEFRVVKASETGTLLWNKAYFVSPRYYMPGPLVACADGNIITTYIITDSTDFKYQFIINKINDDGDMIWQKALTIGTSLENLQSVIELPNGEILVLSSGYDYNVHLKKLDALGNMIWNQTISKENAGDRENGYSMTLAKNGDIVICGDHYDQKKTNYQVLLMQVDQTGSLVWRKNLGYDNRNEIGNCVTTTSSGSFAIAGQSTSPVTAASEVLAMQVNANGELEYYRAFGPGTQNYGFVVVSYPNSSCTFVGSSLVVENGVNQWNVLLSQINGDGTFE